MEKREIYHYYVEGDDEKRLLDVLKREVGCIKSGKVEKFNVIQQKFTMLRIRTLKPKTIVVLVYDTDVETNVNILEYNINFLKKQSGIKGVICIPQVSNLEDELLRACNLKNIVELTNSTTKNDYKRDLIRCSDLASQLNRRMFDIAMFWNRKPTNKFIQFGNDSDKIKILQKSDKV